MRVTDGAAEPLGVTLSDTGANIAVFSAHAEEIHLSLFDAQENETRIRLPGRSGDVFHGHVEGLKEGQCYGLRAFGPEASYEGHRFNGAKLLVDPYALALDRSLSLHPALFGYGDDAREDSAAFVVKGVMTRPLAATSLRPQYAWGERIIYELHVKGFTARHPDVPPQLRGTFAGLAHEASIAHLKKLGVTTLELLPCAAWIDERHLPPLGLSNYWGYNPIAFMAPDPRVAPGGWREVREAVAALHAAGLEVIIDVVFNHTGESDEWGPTLSLRGLDNASYYRLAQDRALYVNDAGCGNILAFERAPVLRLAMDALRAWALYGGVDGFRFDLATTLARRASGVDPDAPFLAALLQDPLLRDLALIAEPWDVGPGGYQLGRFPPAIAEWNDRFRDCARRFWRGDACGVSELATRLAGSQHIFARRSPSRSVNYITAHDGFTLRDLVSYTHKRNEKNGEANRDGADDNLSWNNGAEGESDDPAILAARVRDQRNLLATLLLARGTPMLSMGAETGQTQGGNNNAYAQDNETSWLDWETADSDLIEAAARLIALRKTHPVLREDRFLSGAPRDETLIPDVAWLAPDGGPMSDEDWRDGAAQMLIAALHAPGDRVLAIFNRGAARRVLLPSPRDGHDWRVVFDASGTLAERRLVDVLEAPARVVLLLVEDSCKKPRRPRDADDALVARLAEAAGVSTRWRDVEGAEHKVPRETLIGLLASMKLPAARHAEATDSFARLCDLRDRRALPQHAVAREGEQVVLRLGADSFARLHLTHEDGRAETVPFASVSPRRWRGADGRANNGFEARLAPLPAGRYVLLEENGDAQCRLIVAPPRCWLPETDCCFGFSAQLYSLRRSGDQGIGDFTTLARLAQESARRGAALLAINPLHALFSQDRARASPYYPSDRRFLDPIYIDLAALDGADLDEAAAQALSARESVDYPAVHVLKRAAFEKAFSAFESLSPDSPPVADFARFVAEGGAALRDFALFETISERQGKSDWRTWSLDLRAARPEALAGFAAQHEKRLRFHLFLQWIADRQLKAAADSSRLSLGLCRDLAVGAAPDGAESWRKASRLLDGFSIGAPPDAFSREGQSWGLPAPDPCAVEADGGADFAELLRANMRHAGALRIDHAMGLARLFLTPQGEKPALGAYVSYPVETLLAQLALESGRARCLVVGEDLGTLPWGFRDRLAQANVLSYRVLWFERAGDDFIAPADYPAKAMACAATHDLPTLIGWRMGADIDEKCALGLLSARDAGAAREARAAERRALVAALRREGLVSAGDRDDIGVDELLCALHAYVARTPSLLALAQIEDLCGAAVAVNLPGTDRECPNWRRKAPGTVETLFDSPRARTIIEALRRNLVQIAAP